MTAATREKLTINVPLRRVCRARLTGMVEPVDLFELSPASDQPSWPELRKRYEAALLHYEEGRVAECRDACQAILRDLGDSDSPTRWLLARTEQRLTSPEAPFDPVFSVETK